MQEGSLVFRQAPHLAQLAANHLPRALLRRLVSGALPDAHHRRGLDVDEPLDRLDEVVLETGAAKLAISVDL